MKKQSLKILTAGNNLEACLATIDENRKNLDISLYCLCGDSKQEKLLQEICAHLRQASIIRRFEVFLDKENLSLEKFANSILLQDGMEEDGYIFFLSPTVRLMPNVLARLIDRLEDEPYTAGLNPLFLAGWEDGSPQSVAHLGTVCDCQKYLHYLYEGVPVGSPLAGKTRFFQIAHPGALLARHGDFKACRGFNLTMGHLAWPALCLALKRIRSGGFSTSPDCHVMLANKFDSWEFCGAWNSALQTGRVLTSGLESDYPFRVAEDGLGYRIDAWLCEQAEKPPVAAHLGEEEAARLGWRHSPNPTSLLKYLSCLNAQERSHAFWLATGLTASLPQSFAFYSAQCAEIMAFAKDCGLQTLEAQARDWNARRRRFLHGLLKPGIRLLQKAGFYDCSLDWSRAVYPAWLETGESFSDIRVEASWPKIAVLMPVWNPEPGFLVQAIDSVLAQKYGNWQLCIADDASTNPAIGDILRNYSQGDERIKVMFRKENGHICRASNSALELVDAPYTAFLDHDDMLAPQALACVAQKVETNSDLCLIYSDMDRIDCRNVRKNPLFKPDFDRDLLYTGHLSTYATKVLRDVGGLRPGLEGSQDFDLCLRVTEQLTPEQIAHIPHILYHWRIHAGSTSTTLSAKPYVVEATKRAWLDSAKRQGQDCTLANTATNIHFLLCHEPLADVSCGIILLTDRHAQDPSPELCNSLERLPEYGICPEFYVQSMDGTIPGKTFLAGKPVHVLPCSGTGWAAAVNAAAKAAKEPLLLFLYASIRPHPDCRLDQLVYAAGRTDLAIAGGMAWHKGRLENGGWYPDVTGLPFRLLRHTEAVNVACYAWGQFLLPHHVLGVSWQCMALRREIIAGGSFLDESMGGLALVDFSMRQEQAGLQTLVSPWAQWECRHPEKNPPENEVSKLAEKWGKEIRTSGLRNPNLRAAGDADWTLIF